MEIEKMHNNIIRDIVIRQRLDRENEGANLFSINIKKKPYRIKVLLSIELNLQSSESKISIRTNLPFGYWHNDYDTVEDFIENFKEWAQVPRYYARDTNRRQENKLENRELECLRQPKIGFNNIEVKVYPEAQKWLQKEGIKDFEKLVRELCQIQKEATIEQKKDIDRYVYLSERMSQLKEFLKDSGSRYYGNRTDNTLKFSISKDQYNNQLTQIKKEMEALCKKHSYLELPRFDFKEKKVKPTLKKWKKENTEELKDNWEEYTDEEERQQYDNDFNKYSKQMYQEFVEEKEWDD